MILHTYLWRLGLYFFSIQIIIIWTLSWWFLFHTVLAWFSVWWHYLETLSFLFHDYFGTCDWDVGSNIDWRLKVRIIWTSHLSVIFRYSCSFFTRNWNIFFLRFRYLKICIKSFHITFIKQIFNVNFLLVFRLWFFQRWIMLGIWFLLHLELALSVSSCFFLIVVKVVQQWTIVLTSCVVILVY